MSVPSRSATTPVPVGSATDAVAARVLDAALACVARVGLAKTTLEDVARAAGCSRATVYRRYPGKGPLLEALAAREVASLAVELRARADAATDLEDAMVALVTAVATRVHRHAALQFLLAHEPETLLPHLTFDGAHRVFEFAADVGESALGRFLPADHARRAGEWLARIVLSYLANPSPAVHLTDVASVRALIVQFVALAPPTGGAGVLSSQPELARP